MSTSDEERFFQFFWVGQNVTGLFDFDSPIGNLSLKSGPEFTEMVAKSYIL